MNAYTHILVLILICILTLCIYIQYKPSKEYFNTYYVIPSIGDGLGNQLFNLANGFAYAHITGRECKLHPSLIAKSVHSDINYMNTIFKRISESKTLPTHDIGEIKTYDYPFNVSEVKATQAHISIKSDLHNYEPLEAIRDEFISQLSFNTSIVSSYPKLDTSAFIHIRGGDFLWNASWANLEMVQYYENAVNHMLNKGVKHFYIFTNDKPYAEKFAFIQRIDYTYVDENEIDSLYLMSRCAIGGISANSTYSWWGLYLNTQRPHLLMPKKWVNSSESAPELYFPGATVIDN